MNRPQHQGQHSRRPHENQQCREHGQQCERRQQRGNKKIATRAYNGMAPKWSNCSGSVQSGQETAPPWPHGLLQPLSNIAPKIFHRRPWTLQQFDALDPQLTPTALTCQTFCRSRQQRMYR